MEIFELGMLNTAKYLIRKGVMVPPFYCNLLLGSLGTISAEPDNLLSLIRSLPLGMTWSATGIGAYQHFINCLAVDLGGHVRVGLEDSLYEDPKKARLATNLGLVNRIAEVARTRGREVATPSEARSIIGL